MSNSASEPGLPLDHAEEFERKFSSDHRKIIAQKALVSTETLTILANRRKLESHIFNTKVGAEIKPITRQNASGRCWIYACLNTMRIPFCAKYNMDDFEFSQSYIFFWDKVERCNYMLSAFIDLAKKGAAVDDRTLQHLLNNPTNDGGQWQMLVNLIEKYGVIPNRFWPSPYLADNSRRLGLLLNNKLREYCSKLMLLVGSGAADNAIAAEQKSMMETLYNVIAVCLGSPPSTFIYDYYDKDKKYQTIGPISPVDFYRTHVKPHFNMSTKICLTHDPRPANPYYKLYTVAYLNNMQGTGKVLYINLPIEQLKDCAMRSIEKGEPVWFGCDVGKELDRKTSVLSVDQFDYELVVGTSVRGIGKAERLLYHESEMTHAMVLTAANIQELNGQKRVTKWRIENSWGEDGDGKGYLVMTDDWFSEYVFEVVVDRSLLTEEILSILTQEPIVLPAWDPMGALA